eukprot:2084508-Alexandrium_andersonii.AAC.1
MPFALIDAGKSCALICLQTVARASCCLSATPPEGPRYFPAASIEATGKVASSRPVGDSTCSSK